MKIILASNIIMNLFKANISKYLSAMSLEHEIVVDGLGQIIPFLAQQTQCDYAIIGRNCIISPMVFIGGNCVIDENNLLGAQSGVMQGVHIGHSCTVGMATSVLRKLKPETTILPNIFKKMKVK